MIPRKRINQANMSAGQWTTFTTAVKTLKAQTNHPNYDDLTMAHRHHRHHGQAHERYTFLPWHREYLLKFEDALVAIDPNAMLPYWDWVEQPKLPDALSNAAEWQVIRVMRQGDLISANRRGDVEMAMAKSNYPAFHDRINGPHGAVHNQIGGAMANIEISPRDVLFWLHHAYLDKLWHDWSIEHPTEFPPNGLMGELTNINNRLLPTDIFTHTSRQVFTIAALNYEYI